MDAEEIQQLVTRVVAMRPPKFEHGTAPSVKVTAFEDYLLESAYAAAELEEALHWLDATLASLKEKVEQMTGWEVALPSARGRTVPTQRDVVAAKRTMDPMTFEAGALAKQLRATILRQIERFRFEAQWVISRAYSIISGS